MKLCIDCRWLAAANDRSVCVKKEVTITNARVAEDCSEYRSL